MKRSFVFFPAVLLVLVSSFFVLKGKEPRKNAPVAKVTKGIPAAVVLKSADGGKTWQDISKGLPENLKRGGVWGDGFFSNDRGLYLRAGNSIYHNEPGSTAPVWTKDSFPGSQRNITSVKNGIYAYDFRGRFLKKLNGKSDWSPIYNDFQEQAVRINRTDDWMYKKYKERQVSSLFETSAGTVFIGSNNAVFKSTNGGKTWKVARVNGWVLKMAESKGVLLALSSQGILRSTNEGESWDRLTGEKSVGVAVEPINGGFAAIVFNTASQTSSLHISSDNGKTWSDLGGGFPPSRNHSLITLVAGRQPSLHISSVKQMGNSLICSRSDGIFRSSDRGKTWKLLLPSADNLGFRLTVSGNVIYAMPNRGC